MIGYTPIYTKTILIWAGSMLEMDSYRKSRHGPRYGEWIDPYCQVARIVVESFLSYLEAKYDNKTMYKIIVIPKNSAASISVCLSMKSEKNTPTPIVLTRSGFVVADAMPTGSVAEVDNAWLTEWSLGCIGLDRNLTDILNALRLVELLPYTDYVEVASFKHHGHTCSRLDDTVKKLIARITKAAGEVPHDVLDTIKAYKFIEAHDQKIRAAVAPMLDVNAIPKLQTSGELIDTYNRIGVLMMDGSAIPEVNPVFINPSNTENDKVRTAPIDGEERNRPAGRVLQSEGSEASVVRGQNCHGKTYVPDRTGACAEKSDISFGRSRDY